MFQPNGVIRKHALFILSHNNNSNNNAKTIRLSRLRSSSIWKCHYYYITTTTSFNYNILPNDSTISSNNKRTYSLDLSSNIYSRRKNYYCSALICNQSNHIHNFGTSTNIKPFIYDQVDNSSKQRFTIRKLSSTTTTTKTSSITEPIDLSTLYRYLELEYFTKDEIESIFDNIKQSKNTSESSSTSNNNINVEQHQPQQRNDNDDCITINELQEFLFQRISQDLDYDTQQQQKQKQQHNYNIVDVQNIQREFATYEAKRIMNLLVIQKKKNDSNDINNDNEYYQSIRILKNDFTSRIISIGTSIDMKSTIPIATSMLFVGGSVGIITPAMPFVIENLHLSASQYGMIVSAFALAKLFSNIPAAIAVEKYGRKQFMVYSLAPLLAIAVGGIGMSNSFTELFICRLLAGAGVAALSTAGTLMITDSSTILNRASTLAPVMSAFAAGTALGPAIGGILVDTVGLQITFYSVGISFFGAGILNHYLLKETQQNKQMKFPWHNNNNTKLIDPSKSSNSGNIVLTKAKSSGSESSSEVSSPNAFYDAVGQWVPLLKNQSIRNVMIMNGMYWVALAGSQMTLLPLLLTASTGTFAMTASQVGQVYMGMSCIQFIGNPIFAKISDKMGQIPAIVGGTTLIGCSMAILPMTSTIPELGISLAIWSAGSSMLSTAPIAFISDAVMKQQLDDNTNNTHNNKLDHNNNNTSTTSRSGHHSHSTTNTVARAQAIALLRTCGDIGFLIGAAGIGVLADYTNSLEIAMQCSSVMLLSATSWFAYSQYTTLNTTNNINVTTNKNDNIIISPPPPTTITATKKSPTTKTASTR